MSTFDTPVFMDDDSDFGKDADNFAAQDMAHELDEPRDTTTLTVAQMIAGLKQFPKDWKVYMSIDPEGNSYSGFDSGYTFQFSKDDKAVTLFPMYEGMEYEDICPIEDNRICQELGICRK